MATYINIVSKFDAKGLKQAQAQFSNVGKAIGISVAAISAATVAAGAGIVAFGRESVKAASSLEESLNAVKVAYGDASAGIARLGEDAATRLGVTQAEFNQAAVRFSAFAERVVGVGGNVNGFVNDLTTRAADFASVFNIDVSEALQVFQSGLSGEAEPLKRFGINLLDTEVKAYAVRTAMIKQGETMTETQKVQARYGLLMESTNKTAGDFANTSGSLANSQRILKAAFGDLQAEVGSRLAPTIAGLNQELVKMLPSLEAALIPAAEALGTAFRNQVLPAIQEFTSWLASPEGVQAVQEFATAIATGVQNLIDFTKSLIDNWDAITKVAAVVAIAVIAFQTFTTAAALAQAATILFSGALALTPLGAAVVAVTALAAGFTALGFATEGYRKTVEDAIEVRKESTAKENEARSELENLRLKQIQLQAQVENNVGYMKDHYQKELDTTKSKIGQLEVALQGANSELARFAKLAPAANTVAPASRGEDNRFKNLKNQLEQINEVVTGGSTGGGTTTADRFKKIQKIIQSAQANILKAENAYARARFEINRDYEDRVAALRQSAAERQLDLIQQSQSRITDAFKNATRLGLSDLFNSETTRTLETQVKQLTSRLTVSVTKETEKTAYSSVTDIINGLRDRLTASKTLLANASKLAGLGFKQTFIEQVLETGTETGNALSSAILDAGPDTQRELRDLFGELETVSETGADSLAKSIYDKFGLATRAMKEQSVGIQTELNAALKAESEILTRSLADAAYAFQTQIADIKTQFLLDIAEFDGAFAGLGKTIKALLANLAKLTGAATGDIQAALTAPDSGSVLAGGTVTNNVAIKDIKAATGLVIDELSDVKGAAAYLQARINAAQTYIKSSSSNAAQEMAAASSIADWTKQLSNLNNLATTGEAAGTVININVRTDTTQSQAMVGKTIGNIVTKYVTTGGQVLVSGS